MTEKVRILVVDDHKMVREGIGFILSEVEAFEVIGEAGDGDEAVELARCLKPDVILMDLLMPVKSGIDAMQEIMQENPAARILVLSSTAEDEMVFAAFRNGAAGYVVKDASGDELIRAIQNVARGETTMPPQIARKLMRRVSSSAKSEAQDQIHLTRREAQILKMIVQGLTNFQIAAELKISEHTVYGHVNNLLGKLKAVNRTQAALFALRSGLVKPDA